MKMMKKAFALMLTLAIVMSLAVTAFAADPQYKLKITNPANSRVNITGKTFTAYRVFTVTKNAKGVYNYNVAPGYETFSFDMDPDDAIGAVSGEDLIKALEGADHATMIRFAKEVAKVTGPTTYNSGPVSGSVPNPQTAEINVPGAGYYVVMCADGKASDTSNPANDVFVGAVVKTAESETTEIVLKAAAPTMDKTAKKSTAKDDKANWKDALEAEVGSTINFKLTSSVPNLEGFDKGYKMIFKDHLSKGLDLTASTIAVKIGDKVVTTSDQVSIVPDTTADKNAFSVEIKDLAKAFDATGATVPAVGTPVVVTYDAVINNKALSQQDVANSAVLRYMNNPDVNDPDQFGPDTPIPENPDPDNPVPFDETPPDVVPVYSVGIGVDKHDAKAPTTKLAGAEFVLYKTDNKAYDGTRSYYKYDDAAGKITWTVAADGAAAVDKKTATVRTSDDKGDIEFFKGLESGTYFLEELTAPDGYNKLEKPIEVDIAVSFSADGKSAEKVTFTFTNLATAAELNKDVKNFAVVGGTTYVTADALVPNQGGSKLPETGGIGTTIFYTIGAVMMASALVLLITKKKMSVN